MQLLTSLLRESTREGRDSTATECRWATRPDGIGNKGAAGYCLNSRYDSDDITIHTACILGGGLILFLQLWVCSSLGLDTRQRPFLFLFLLKWCQLEECRLHIFLGVLVWKQYFLTFCFWPRCAIKLMNSCTETNLYRWVCVLRPSVFIKLVQSPGVQYVCIHFKIFIALWKSRA